MFENVLIVFLKNVFYFKIFFQIQSQTSTSYSRVWLLVLEVSFVYEIY
jgi:hypothetical protein